MGTYLLITPKKDELYHHGIKGQKWGVRRFQNKDGTRTKAGKDRAKYARERKLSDEQKLKKNWKTGSDMIYGHDKNVHELNARRFSDGRVGYFPAATVLKDFMRDTGAPPSDMTLRPRVSSFTGRELSGHNAFLDTELIREINPHFGEEGTTQNCTKSTAALELARYGIKVQAGRQRFPASSDAMSYWFDGAEKSTGKIDEIEKKLSSYGDGASGSISGFYPGGSGGHCMHFSVHHGGSVYVQDGQNGRSFVSIQEAAKAYGFDTSRDMEAFRLDTATPNWDHMAEDSVVSTPEDGARVWTVDGRDGQIYKRY